MEEASTAFFFAYSSPIAATFGSPHTQKTLQRKETLSNNIKRHHLS